MVVMFNEEQLDKVFFEISGNLQFPIDGFLIGGLAMIKNKMKTATKDIDIVFSSEREARAFMEAALDVGFELDSDLPPEYEEMGPSYVLIDPEERRLDVFVKVVVRKLEYTDAMKRRSKELKYGKLRIHVSSINDIFLFKCVATRPRDLDDMELLAKTGYLDWTVVEGEARNQRTPWKWIGILYSRLMELEDKSGITAPNMKELGKEAELGQGIELVLNFLQNGSLSRSELINKFDEVDASFAENVILRMIEMRLIRDENGRLVLIEK